MPPKVPVGLEAIVARGPQSQLTPKHLLTSTEELPVETLGQQAITYDEWMEATKRDWKHPRSSRLKAIDKALKALEEDPASVKKATALRTAINDWIRWKGPTQWKQSTRNQDNDHIVERLRVWAFAPGLPTAMTQEEVKAYEFLEESRKQALHTLFRGKKVQLKMQSALVQGASMAKDVKTAATQFKRTVDVLRGAVTTPGHTTPSLSRGVSAVQEAGRVSKEFVTGDLLDVKNLDTNTLQMVKDSIPMEQITTDFIPFVNLVTGGVGLIVKWGKVAKAAHAVHKTEDARYVIELGDPQRAFDGVMTCLKRDRTAKTLQASQATAKFAVQTAGTFADMGAATGPAVAAANAAATLAHKLFLFGREMKEVQKANQILRHPDNLDFRLFQEYPLAGCYMIRCATLSDIITMSTVQFGNPGWMDDIELMKKKYVDPLRKHCDNFIKQSLFEIPDMPLLKMKN